LGFVKKRASPASGVGISCPFHFPLFRLVAGIYVGEEKTQILSCQGIYLGKNCLSIKKGFSGKNLDTRYGKCKLGGNKRIAAGNPIEHSRYFLGKEAGQTGMVGAG
jgi:hypothetical protein